MTMDIPAEVRRSVDPGSWLDRSPIRHSYLQDISPSALHLIARYDPLHWRYDPCSLRLPVRILTEAVFANCQVGAEDAWHV